MKIVINGALGYMGRELSKLCEGGYKNSSIAYLVDARAEEGSGIYPSLASIQSPDADCIIDFSHHTATEALLSFAVEKGLPCVVCTTGHTDEEIALIHQASKSVPVFYSGNMSLGIALLVELAKTTALAMPEAEIEIVESHHNRKLDAPSGTALMLANAITEVRPEAYTNLGRSGHGKRSKDEIGIHSIRMGNIVGIHEVIIGTPNQTITLKHEAHDRALFAEGALSAAAFLIGKEAGLYDMKSIVSEEKTSAELSAVI